MPRVEPPPIALTSLSIRDFRGIDRLDLDFRGPDGLPNRLAVFAGPNGSGKTAVLEAALLACGGQSLLTGAHGVRAIRRGARTYEIHAEGVRADQPFELRATARTGATSRDTVPHWYFSSWRAPKLVGAVDVSVGRGRRPAKTDANRLKNVKQALVNAAVAERFGQETLPFAEKSRRWLGAISEGWLRFYPGSGQTFRVDFVEPEREGGGSFDVFLADARRDAKIELDRLSSGQLELFLFLAALVLNEDREGIVFIDEPELHLDPQWHAPIVRTLMGLQPRAQFFVATHSPSIYESASSFERHFLVPDDDPRAAIWGRAQARN